MGSKADTPDYSGLIDAANNSYSTLSSLGRDQLEFAKEQYNDLKPLYESLVDSQLGLQNQALRNSTLYNQTFQNTYMPMMAEYANDARNFNTEAYREELAQKAAVDTARAFTTMQGATNRSLASMGINPNSGRFMGITRANEANLAAQRAGAMTSARRTAEAEGQNRVANAINVGQNFANMGNASGQLALTAGSTAGNTAMAVGNNYMNNLSAGIGTIGNAYSSQMNGLSSVLNSQTSIYGSQAAQMGSIYGGIGNLVGTAGGIGLAEWV